MGGTRIIGEHFPAHSPKISPSSTLGAAGEFWPRLHCVLVLGMHRSGTSALTGLLAMSGIAVPGELLPSAPDNPKGFFENKAVLDLHEKLLRQLKSGWDDPLPFNSEWLQSDVGEAAVQALAATVRAEVGENSTFVFKDPRTSRLIPLWRQALRGYSKLSCVHILRHPSEVCASLRDRNDMEQAHTAALWLRYVLDAERDTRGLRRSFIRYDELLRDWRPTLRKIGTEVDIRWPFFFSRVEDEVNTFISDRLRHQRSSDLDRTAPDGLAPLCGDVWDALIKLEIDPSDASAQRELDEAREQFDQAASLFGPILIADRQTRDRLRSEIDNASAVRHELATEIEDLRNEIALSKSTAAESLEEAAAIARRLRAELAETHIARDGLASEIAALRGEISAAERSANAESLEAAVEAARLRAELEGAAISRKELACELAKVEQQLEEQNRLRIALAASTSWRLTMPLRVLRRMLRGDWGDLTRLRQRFVKHNRLSLRVNSDATVGTPTAPRTIEVFPRLEPRLPRLVAARHDPVDIIICVHNALDDLRRCITSVFACTLPPFRLILVDDGSENEVRDMLIEFARNHAAHLIRHDTAQGYTRAANVGLRAATAPWMVLLNSDTVVTPDWLDRMVEHAKADPQIGLIGPLSNTASWQSVPEVQENGDWAMNPLPSGLGTDEMAMIVAASAARQSIPLPFLNGFCLLLRRELVAKIGLFDEENFGEGYGEENDYCIRARKAGWRSVVADDVFVHHAQSRSYSHDRRRMLVARADQSLKEKHDFDAHIGPQVLFCRDSLYMAGARARVASGISRHDCIKSAKAQWEGKRIAFLLPVMDEGGGANVVLQEAQALRRMGVDATIVNLAPHRERFSSSYSAPEISILYAESESAVSDLVSSWIPAFDAVVATAFNSVAWLPPPNRGPVCAYYIQDFEPWFFAPDDARHIAALRTYTERSDIRRFTKTTWNAEKVRFQGGFPVDIIGPSVDVDLFRPAPGSSLHQKGPVRVTAMVRPSTPRRQPALTAQVLRHLKDCIGESIILSAFGADHTELAAADIDLAGITCLGRLNRSEMAGLLQGTDIFLDFSEFQAMGLTALEAMASGCAVVVPKCGGAIELAADGGAALVIDSSDPTACRDGALRLVADHDLRARLRQKAVIEAPQYAPEFAAARMLQTIFKVQ